MDRVHNTQASAGSASVHDATESRKAPCPYVGAAFSVCFRGWGEVGRWEQRDERKVERDERGGRGWSLKMLNEDEKRESRF